MQMPPASAQMSQSEGIDYLRVQEGLSPRNGLTPVIRETIRTRITEIDRLLMLDPVNENLRLLKSKFLRILNGEESVDDRINVTDTDFVPEGFHENSRNEDGSIKVTERNEHLYRDNDHLVKMYKDGLWGCEKGVTYTTDQANCPEGRAPIIEAVNSLSLRKDIKFRGRIVCEGGKVYDADTPLIIEEIGKDPNHPANTMIQKEFQEAIRFHQANKYMRDEEYEPSFKVDRQLSQKLKIPSGEFKLKERCFKIDEEGLSMFSLCDQPECCIMNHAMLGVCAAGFMPPQVKQMTLDYFKTRKIYNIEDDINGNFEMCYKCLKENCQ